MLEDSDEDSLDSRTRLSHLKYLKIDSSLKNDVLNK